MRRFDLVIVGAGPAGMTAAIEATQHGLKVLVVDEQPESGGQIWRAVGRSTHNDRVLGTAYVEGRATAEHFEKCGAEFLASTRVWQIEPGFRIFMSTGDIADVIIADAVVIAAGAQERPTPFPGWTLPGVMTVGAAQILLKGSSQVPTAPVWIAGSGPLPLLYAVQLLRAGASVAGFLDTTPRGRWKAALRHLPAALRKSGDLLKGLLWTATLRRSGIQVRSGVTGLEAHGDEALSRVRFVDGQGNKHVVQAELLLIHEGVIPSVHLPMSLGCRVTWDAQQDCYVPALSDWGETTVPGLFIAGDGAGIAGAKAAGMRGRLSALEICRRAGSISEEIVLGIAHPIRNSLRGETAIRPFLDEMFKPRAEVFDPADETIVCRCEEVTAGELRSLATGNRLGPNQLKTVCRAGMGPCQGRQCGYTVSRILAETQRRPMSEVGFFNIRPPLKPVTLGELAMVEEKLEQ